jgi:flagellar basal-body rod protein FlgC
MFEAINESGSGLATYQTFLDATANNIANVNDASPTSGPAFQAQYIEAQANATGTAGVGGGVHVAGIALSSAQGVPTYDPTSPAADAQGYIRRPDIDMGEQMGNLIMAQRAFQANSNAVERAKDVYQYAIDIGKKA